MGQIVATASWVEASPGRRIRFKEICEPHACNHNFTGFQSEDHIFMDIIKPIHNIASPPAGIVVNTGQMPPITDYASYSKEYMENKFHQWHSTSIGGTSIMIHGGEEYLIECLKIMYENIYDEIQQDDILKGRKSGITLKCAIQTAPNYSSIHLENIDGELIWKGTPWRPA